jgi:hypothetical protein
LLSTCSLGRLTLAPVGMEALALWEWLMLTIAPPRNAAMLSRQRCARGARGGGVRGCGTVGVSSSEGKFANLPATGLFCLSVRSERSAVHDNDYAPHGSNDTAADYALHCLLHPVFHMHSAMHDDSYRLAGLYIRVHLKCTDVLLAYVNVGIPTAGWPATCTAAVHVQPYCNYMTKAHVQCHSMQRPRSSMPSASTSVGGGSVTMTGWECHRYRYRPVRRTSMYGCTWYSCTHMYHGLTASEGGITSSDQIRVRARTTVGQ